MRYLPIILLLGILAACSSTKPVPPPVVDAAKNTLSWDRGNEPDLKEYRVYVCWLPNCDPAVVNTMLKVVKQTEPWVRPSYWRELAGSVGAYAVTAVDTHGNESRFSVPLAFDRR